MADQEDGGYPRINGKMLQTGNYNGMIVSAVGKVVAANMLEAADGTSITLDASQAVEPLVVNAEMYVEIIGSVDDATTITAFISRELSADMDMTTYNKMIELQQSGQYSHYFQNS
eukprot:Nitzschia sp. Nitz4//scaffold124_size66437//18478//18897//NITZ4_006107-RA/size66437-processed-gene-0.83-mRNA-1//1//CDS//3329534540//4889//frame0